MAKEVTDVIDIVVDHSGAFKTETPSNDGHIFGKAHRLKHLRAEHTRVTDFDPLLELWVIAEDFKRWLRVRIVRRLVLQLFDSDLLEESFHDTKEVVKANAAVTNDTFNLVELSQMSCIKSLVAEDTVDGEEFHRLELLLLSEIVKHLRADSSGVCAENILHSLLTTPARAVADSSRKSLFVSALDTLLVLFWDALARYGILTEESVLKVTSRVALRLEKCIEIPEAGLNPTISRHLIEAHGKKNLAELLTDFE